MIFLIALVLAPLILLSSCFSVELFFGIRPLPSLAKVSSDAPETVIIVPAHDEQAILAERLAELKDAAAGLARILVVADNCSDSTAEIAMTAGADVVERNDPARRGKGFALHAAKLHLLSHPPDVVLIIDADCQMDRQSIALLSACCAALDSPCQATNLQRARSSSPPTVRLSTFAFYIKNVVRQRALQRLTGRVHLLGTGMAFPWRLFEAAQLATSEVVEDLKLGLELSGAGHPPVLIESATIWSNAETGANTLSQRSRWEGGFLRAALGSGPALFAKSLRKRDLPGLWAAIDVMIPPFALLLTLDLLALAAAAGLALFAGIPWWPVLLLLGLLALACAGMILGWATGGCRFVSLGDLARAPLYVLWKLPLYMRLLRRGAPGDWKRTDRSAA